MPVLNPEKLTGTLVGNIRKLHKDSGITRAELDLSGGIDSAVMLELLVRAIGADNVTATYIGINSSTDSMVRAHEAAAHAGVKLIYLDLTFHFDSLIGAVIKGMVDGGYDADELWKRLDTDKTILGSIRSTLRAPVGRACNRISGGGIRHGTGNEDEDRILRFFQKGGDGEVDTNPISMLSKGEIFQLARYLGVPASILSARPSPDLWGVGEQHSDEDEIAAYLGVQGRGLTMYSYIDMETGEYKNVGMIERISRLADGCLELILGLPSDAWFVLFDQWEEPDWEEFVQQEKVKAIFKGVKTQDVIDLLKGARRVEHATRHKMNPNCPALTLRRMLVDEGSLTDMLPV
jgi:NAD+ synthase